MKRWRPLLTTIMGFGLSVGYAHGQLLKPTTNHFVRINEVMAGHNGDSRIQFIEMVAQDGGQKDWASPCAFGNNTTPVGCVMLVFFDAAGNQTGRFVVTKDPAPGALTVLFATQEFAALTGITPDFIIPPLLVPIAGKVCYKANPDKNNEGFPINLCLSYGGAAFTGSTEGAGAANGASLSILGSQSLTRNTNFGFSSFGPGTQKNADFALGTPTPNSTQNNATGVTTNAAGQAGLPGASSAAIQGKNLFTKERFLGNGRTCATCHLESESFGLTPATVASLPSTDPLFVNQVNVNTIVVNSAGSVNPTAPSGTTQPSDFFIGKTITGSLGGSATVLAGTGKTYLILGGSSLNIPGNVISDPSGNKGTLVSFTPGNLSGPNPVNGEARGLEDTPLLTGGRALITENINGFTKKTFMRESPNLLNIKHTGPFGLSGEITTLQTFAAGAVEQHFTRSLLRVAGTDFRLPTTAEQDAMATFMETINLPADEDFDETNNFDKFVTTEAQKRGRDLFFGEAKCSVCHSGNVLADSDGRFGTMTGVNEAFNTGVANLPINTIDGLPSEEDVGAAPNSREFSTRPLFGVKNTAPFFHDNSFTTLLEAIQFYDTAFFRASPAATQVGTIEIVGIFQNAKDIQAFLEGLVDLPFTFTRILNFGDRDVNAGPTSAMTITLTNTGTEAITINSLTFNGANPGEFANGSPVPDSGPFSTGESRTLNVTFDPSSAGAKQATLEMKLANSIDSWDVGVALSGTGTGSAVTQNLTIKSLKLNNISFNNEGAATNIATTLADLENLVVAQDDLGQFFIPQFFVNTIGNVDKKKGYQVFISGQTNDAFSKTGVPFDPTGLSHSFTNTKLFNIGFPYQCAQDIDAVFASIFSSIVIVQDDEGKFLIPDFFVDTIVNMQPGKGYQIFLKEAKQFTYPNLTCNSNTSLKSSAIPSVPEPIYFQFYRTGMPYAIVITGSESELAPGDEIAAFAGNRCVGAAIFTEKYPLAIPAWEGSEQHNLPGFKGGETILLRVWKADAQRELAVPAYFRNDAETTFKGAPMSVASLGAGKLSTTLPGDYALEQNYPNPFNPITIIRYELPKATLVTLKVYDVNGQEVAVLVNGKKEAGAHLVQFDAAKLPNAVYLYRIQTDEFVKTKKLILLK